MKSTAGPGSFGLELEGPTKTHDTAMTVFWRPIRIALLAIILVALSVGCATGPYTYQEAATLGFENRAVTQQQGALTVRASVPGTCIISGTRDDPS